MNEPRLGKLDTQTLARAVWPRLGAARREVLLGPRPGCDAAIIDLGDGRVLATTTDPLSIIPALGAERSGWLAAHLVASDLATTGIAPQYASVTLNLPPDLPAEELEAFTAGLDAAWRQLGVAVVTGHTGRYAGCGLTIVGACTLLGVGAAGAWIAPSMAAPGDRVLIAGSAALESGVLAAWVAPDRVASRIGEAGVARLRERVRELSAVAAARAAAAVGVRERGVTAMHDATEGGMIGGLCELAIACGHTVRVERRVLPLDPDVAGACAALGIDPHTSLAEGALIVCVQPGHAGRVREAIAAVGIAVTEVGEVLAGEARLVVAETGGRLTTLDAPPADPWWPAYAAASRGAGR